MEYKPIFTVFDQLDFVSRNRAGFVRIVFPGFVNKGWVDLKRPELTHTFTQNQGGITEFNFSALKFVLQELSEMALRYVSRDLTECESLGSIGDSGSLATSRDNVSLCSNSSFNEY